jgi:HAD superfamily hydrolase (TIGR01490 family)
MMKLAIYDMDKTITRRATFGPFLAYAVPRYRPWRMIFWPLVALTSLCFLLKLIDRARLKEINLGLLLGHHIDRAQLAAIARGFAGRTLATNILPLALDQIAQDQAAGRRVVIASASYAFYVREIAALLGVDAVVATEATEATEARGALSPPIVGENCYAQAKLDMVKAWLAAEGIKREAAHIRFYSDHVSDAPCLDWADEAFATNPHAALRRLAGEKGWAVVDWG